MLKTIYRDTSSVRLGSGYSKRTMQNKTPKQRVTDQDREDLVRTLDSELKPTRAWFDRWLHRCVTDDRYFALFVEVARTHEHENPPRGYTGALVQALENHYAAQVAKNNIRAERIADQLTRPSGRLRGRVRASC